MLAHGSMSSNTSGEGEISQAIIEADLVDYMATLPPQLCYSTQIATCSDFSHATRPKANTATTAGRRFTLCDIDVTANRKAEIVSRPLWAIFLTQTVIPHLVAGRNQAEREFPNLEERWGKECHRTGRWADKGADTAPKDEEVRI